MTPRHYYVWYRLAGAAAPARAAITAMMLELAATTGVAGRLLVRADDARTWMEIYEDVDDAEAFERALGDAVVDHRADTLADGGRHVERFCGCGDAGTDA
jgi:hypothetical protein